MIGDKLGDNAQVEMIADSLGLPYQIKRLLPSAAFVSGKPRFRASLEHLDLQCSDALSPPWPDLVITIGRRHSMAALWIKQQFPQTKLVLLGRPRRWIERFDLVITLPQYRVPDMANVLRLSLPLMRTDDQAVSAAVTAWQARFQSLPKPVIAVLVGGPTRPFQFDARVTRGLLGACRKVHERYGGTLYFSTSRRTSPQIIDTLRTQLPQNAQLYQWRPGDADNPYIALLGLADYFIVSGDSISMMVEVADRHKPLAIFPLPATWQGRIWQSFTHRLHADPGSALANRLFRWLGKSLYKCGTIGFTRDLTLIHNALVKQSLATYLGTEAFAQPAGSLPDELAGIRKRILALLPPEA